MSFDLLAPHYRWMEWFLAGEKLQRCRTAFLDDVPEARAILLVGEGNGRCLLECVRRFPEARIICVDGSAGMIRAARRRLARHGCDPARVTFVHADLLSWQPPENAHDLIITHFFLDCFGPDQLARVIPALANSAKAGAHWLLADFQVAPDGVGRARSRIILALMYGFFRIVTRLPAKQLTAPDPLLNQCGFMLRRRVEREWRLLRSDWWCRATSGNVG